MNLKSWKRATFVGGVCCVVAGPAIMVIEALIVGRTSGGAEIQAFLLGGVGTVVCAIGALLVRWSVFGPLPKSLQDQKEGLP